MTRDELIVKMGNAIEGGRELDANIAASIAPGTGAYYVADGDRPIDADAGEWLLLKRTEEGQVVTNRPHHYTTSLDAAVSLVPLGLGWEVTFRREDHVYVAGVAADRNPATGRYDRYEMQARTAPLALSGAALRARGAVGQAN